MNDMMTTLTRLVRLCSWDTVNQRKAGSTALDLAVDWQNPAIALYLSWLGAESLPRNTNSYLTTTGKLGGAEVVRVTYTTVNLDTWRQAGRHTLDQAQFWAVAAGDIRSAQCCLHCIYVQVCISYALLTGQCSSWPG